MKPKEEKEKEDSQYGEAAYNDLVSDISKGYELTQKLYEKSEQALKQRDELIEKQSQVVEDFQKRSNQQPLSLFKPEPRKGIRLASTPFAPKTIAPEPKFSLTPQTQPETKQIE